MFGDSVIMRSHEIWLYLIFISLSNLNNFNIKSMRVVNFIILSGINKWCLAFIHFST